MLWRHESRPQASRLRLCKKPRLDRRKAAGGRSHLRHRFKVRHEVSLPADQLFQQFGIGIGVTKGAGMLFRSQKPEGQLRSQKRLLFTQHGHAFHLCASLPDRKGTPSRICPIGPHHATAQSWFTEPCGPRASQLSIRAADWSCNREGIWPMRLALPAFVALLGASGPGAAQDTDLELVLLADASGSITQQELLFQREGYAAAITDPEVLAVIAGTAYGHIAVTYVEWAANQAQVVDWTLIDGPEAAQGFADTLLAQPRQAYGRNAIGAALLEGLRLMDQNDIEGWRRVIDFSGDSAGNWSGPGIEDSRDQVVAQGVTINALPILRPDDPGRAQGGLEAVYERRLIGGVGAFVVTAESRDSFAEAVKRKLILEISGTLPRHVAQARQAP